MGHIQNPDYLKLPDWFKSTTEHNTDLANNFFSQDEDALEIIFNKATDEIIREQTEIGIDVITDGEARRENYIIIFVEL